MVIRPGRLVTLPTSLPPIWIPMMLEAATGTKSESPGSVVNPMLPSRDGLGKVWPAWVTRVNLGGAVPASCTLALAMALLLGVMVKLVKRLPGAESTKLKLVMPTVENRLTGMLPLCPAARVAEPTPNCTHSPTTTSKVMELLNGGWPLSVAQMVMKLVVLPCAHEGLQLNTPLVVMAAPSGAAPSVKVTGGVAATAVLVMTRYCPTTANCS